jgi:preprotein translocase subunit SecD
MVRRSLLLFSLFWMSAFLLMGACNTPPKQKTSAPPLLEFRMEAEPNQRTDAIGFQTMHYKGENVLLSPPRRYMIERAWREDVGSSGAGVHFVIYAEQRGDFQRWTGANSLRRMAILMNGQILAMPKLQAALPGEGIIAGSLSNTEADRIVENLTRDS